MCVRTLCRAEAFDRPRCTWRSCCLGHSSHGQASSMKESPTPCTATRVVCQHRVNKQAELHGRGGAAGASARWGASESMVVNVSPACREALRQICHWKRCSRHRHARRRRATRALQHTCAPCSSVPRSAAPPCGTGGVSGDCLTWHRVSVRAGVSRGSLTGPAGESSRRSECPACGLLADASWSLES